MKNLSNKQRKLAKKRFPKQKHSTRPFTAKDYAAIVERQQDGNIVRTDDAAIERGYLIDKLNWRNG